MSASNHPQTVGQGERPERHCLILQLSRTGDILQSLLALKAVKRLYPSLHISMVVRETFAESALNVSWIEKTYVLDTPSLVAESAVNRVAGLKWLANWVSPILEKKWDYVVDWTFSEPSSWLSSLIPAKDRLGYSRGEDFSIRCSDGWTQYVQAVLQSECAQNIHVTDILATQLLTALQIRDGDPEPAGEGLVTERTFFGNLAPPILPESTFTQGRWIAIHLGASKDQNAWRPSSWAALATLILERHPDVRILLLGKEEDASKEKAFFSALSEKDSVGSRIYSFIGKTDFKQWVSTLARCHWMFSAKTSAFHMAGILGTRVLALHPGDKTWMEAGPYGNGHLLILPTDREGGLHSLSAEAVYWAWTHGSGNPLIQRKTSLHEHFKKSGVHTLFSSFRMFQSRIREPDAGGGVSYEPCSLYPLLEEEWIAGVQGHIARAWYCGWVPKIGQEMMREAISPELIRILRALRPALHELSRLSIEAKELSSELRELGQKQKSDRVMRVEDRIRIQEQGKLLLDHGQKIEQLSREVPAFRSFGRMLQVMMHNLEGTRLHEMGYESALNFRQLEEGLKIYMDWIDFTLGLTKPRALPVVPKEATT